jgi:prepilin-type N-terminal cleavage/methylation domain-containing protein
MKSTTRLAQGFTLLEVVVVLAITLIVFSMSILGVQAPLHSYRASGDATAMTEVLSLTRLRAAESNTHARLSCSLTTNSCQGEILNRTTNSYQSDTSAYSLSSGNSFSLDGIDAPPNGTQSALSQASPCLDNAGASIANTACIVFNSRGIPIDATTLAPTKNDALYLANGTNSLAVTVSPTGAVSLWQNSQGSWKAY